MTDRLEKAVAVVRRMPAAERDTIAQARLSLARIGEGTDGDDIEPQHSAAVLEGTAQADRGAFATDEDVASRLPLRAVKLRLTRRAPGDLDAIDDDIHGHDPAAALRVRADGPGDGGCSATGRRGGRLPRVSHDRGSRGVPRPLFFLSHVSGAAAGGGANPCPKACLAPPGVPLGREPL